MLHTFFFYKAVLSKYNDFNPLINHVGFVQQKLGLNSNGYQAVDTSKTKYEQKHKEPVSWSFINSVMISEQKQSEPVQWSFSNAVAVLDQKHTEPDHNSFAKAAGKQQHKEPVLITLALPNSTSKSKL